MEYYLLQYLLDALLSTQPHHVYAAIGIAYLITGKLTAQEETPFTPLIKPQGFYNFVGGSYLILAVLSFIGH